MGKENLWGKGEGGRVAAFPVQTVPHILLIPRNNSPTVEYHQRINLNACQKQTLKGYTAVAEHFSALENTIHFRLGLSVHNYEGGVWEGQGRYWLP